MPGDEVGCDIGSELDAETANAIRLLDAVVTENEASGPAASAAAVPPPRPRKRNTIPDKDRDLTEVSDGEAVDTPDVSSVY